MYHLHSQYVCFSFSVRWMTFSHYPQRCVYSLFLPLTQWINGCWECSSKALGSIHQANRRPSPSHPMFVLQTVWIFICPILCVCVSALMSLVCKFMGVLGYRCISVVLRAYCRSRLLTHTNQKPWLLLMPPFPRQRLPGSDCKSLPLCFSALSSAVRPILHCQSAAAAVCGIN